MTEYREHINPGTAPGQMYVRVVTDTGHVLAERPLPNVAVASVQGGDDLELADAWLRIQRRTDGRVHIYLYDGDTGDCLNTIIVNAETFDTDIDTHLGPTITRATRD